MTRKRTLHQPKDESPVHNVVASVSRGEEPPLSASAEETLTLGSATDNPLDGTAGTRPKLSRSLLTSKTVLGVFLAASPGTAIQMPSSSLNLLHNQREFHLFVQSVLNPNLQWRTNRNN